MSEAHYTEYWKGMDIAIAMLDTETNDSYQGFLCFVSLKGKQRSTERVAQLLGYHEGTVKIWQQNHKWMDRASGVDAQVFIKEQQERDQLTREDNEKFAKENARFKDRALKITNKMMEVAENLLQSATLANKMVETGHVIDAHGRKVPTHTEIHMKAKVSDIPRLVDTAVKTTRLVNELPTDIVRTTIPNSSALSSMTDEELTRMREDNREVLVRHGLQEVIDKTDSKGS
jgi:membrane-bound inhibitor of C-type lysozyme